MIVPDQNAVSMNTTEGPPRRFEEGRTARRLSYGLDLRVRY
jgi:hypothetical protein